MSKNEKINEDRKKIGEIILRCREEKGLPQILAAKQLNITPSLLSHYEQGNRNITQGHRIAIASFYGINEKDISCFSLPEKRTALFYELLSLCSIRLVLLISDINRDYFPKKINKSNKEDNDLDSLNNQWVIGGGAFYASKAALSYGFTPVLFSTIGKDEEGILNVLKHELKKASKGTPGINTYLVEKNFNSNTSKCNIEFKTDNNKHTWHQFYNHCNDFELSRLEDAINICGELVKIIFFHSFRLNRKMIAINADEKIPKDKKDMHKKEFAEKFMESLLPENTGARPIKRPVIVLDLAPPSIYENMHFEALKILIEKSDIMVAELRSLLGFLVTHILSEFPAYEREAIVADFGEGQKDITGDVTAKPYFKTIIKCFLGKTEKKILIIRYGLGHMDYETIIERKNGKPEIIENKCNEINNTGYSRKKVNEKLGYGDMRTFAFLESRQSDAC